MKEGMISGIILILLIVNVNALPVEDNDKTNFGHLTKIENISIPELAPGESGILKINLKNSAGFEITDIRAKLTLPKQLQFLNDVSEVKMSVLKSGESKEIGYRIIALPDADEGIYSADLTIDYINHFLANYVNLGQEKRDNYTLGIIIRSIPSIFMQLDNADVYKGKDIGDITLKFVNNGTSNIKFLTVSLEETEGYEIISDSNYYIGDLDSDDFESVKFKIKLNTKEDSLTFPVKISYKDSMNNYYSKDLKAELKIRSASELGKGNNNYIYAIVIILIIFMAFVYYLYRKYNKRKDGRFF